MLNKLFILKGIEMKREINNKTQLMARLNACNVCRVYNHVLMIFECHSLIQNVISLSSNNITIIQYIRVGKHLKKN